jgi:hypothetical protein
VVALHFIGALLEGTGITPLPAVEGAPLATGGWLTLDDRAGEDGVTATELSEGLAPVVDGTGFTLGAILGPSTADISGRWVALLNTKLGAPEFTIEEDACPAGNEF